jgi:hypothetical protein
MNIKSVQHKEMPTNQTMSSVMSKITDKLIQDQPKKGIEIGDEFLESIEDGHKGTIAEQIAAVSRKVSCVRGIEDNTVAGNMVDTISALSGFDSLATLGVSTQTSPMLATIAQEIITKTECSLEGEANIVKLYEKEIAKNSSKEVKSLSNEIDKIIGNISKNGESFRESAKIIGLKMRKSEIDLIASGKELSGKEQIFQSLCKISFNGLLENNKTLFDDRNWINPRIGLIVLETLGKETKNPDAKSLISTVGRIAQRPNIPHKLSYAIELKALNSLSDPNFNLTDSLVDIGKFLDRIERNYHDSTRFSGWAETRMSIFTAIDSSLSNESNEDIKIRILEAKAKLTSCSDRVKRNEILKAAFKEMNTSNSDKTEENRKILFAI